MAVLLLVAGLLGAVFASLSNGVAVLARQRETLIGIVTMVTLPLTFLSSALMQQSLLPDWIRWIAKFNPVDPPGDHASTDVVERDPVVEEHTYPYVIYFVVRERKRERRRGRSNTRNGDRCQHGRFRCRQRS